MYWQNVKQSVLHVCLRSPEVDSYIDATYIYIRLGVFHHQCCIFATSAVVGFAFVIVVIVCVIQTAYDAILYNIDLLFIRYMDAFYSKWFSISVVLSFMVWSMWKIGSTELWYKRKRRSSSSGKKKRRCKKKRMRRNCLWFRFSSSRWIIITIIIKRVS